MKQTPAPSLPSVTRRRFLRSTALATALAPGAMRSLAADAPVRLKAAVIGHTGRGDYGHGLEGIFQNRTNVELVALADPDADGRAKTMARVKAPRSYADYRELLEKEKPDLVSIAMRHADQHHAIALAALRAGAHVYCEKPFTTTPAEADELLGEAGKRQRRIAVAHTLRLSAPYVRLRQALSDGLIGDLIEMRAHGKQDARAGGEDMMVLGTHLFDLMRMYAGDPLSCAARVLWQGRDIAAADRRIVKDNVGFVAGDRVFAQFAFANGVNATFTSVGALREGTGGWGIEFTGSKGAARIVCDTAPHVFVRSSGAWKSDGRADAWQPLDRSLAESSPPSNTNAATDWLDAIANKREPVCSGRNGAWAVEMVMAVYHAALSGSRIAFPLKTRTHPLA